MSSAYPVGKLEFTSVNQSVSVIILKEVDGGRISGGNNDEGYERAMMLHAYDESLGKENKKKSNHIHS